MMKKSLLSLFVITFMAVSVSSAQPLLPKRHYFSAGVSIPIGDFKDKSYAKQGYCISWERTSFILKYFGLGSIISYQSQGMDNSLAAQGLVANYDDIAEATVDADGYSSVIFMMGAYGRLPFADNKFEIHAKAGAGLLWAQFGNAAADLVLTDESTRRVNFAKDGTINFTYYAGGSIQYNPGKMLGIRLNTEVTGANPKFKINATGPDNKETLEIEENMTFVNISLGITLKIL